ncbi:hypothetical protein ACFZDK_27585 [Streptomyces sp. NPDC007901]
MHPVGRGRAQRGGGRELAVGTDGTAYSTWWHASGGWAGWFRLGIT